MKHIGIALGALLMCGHAQAQSLKDLFLQMPQEVCPSLSEYNRLEIVDNQKNNKPMQTRNHFRTLSTMQTLTDTYALLRVSKAAEKEMKLLPTADGGNVILVISTVYCDSIPDSSISFYSTSWQPLDANNYISSPLSDEFRHISIDADTDRLTIETSNPLALQLNGSNEPIQPTITATHITWDRDKSMFLPE